MLQRTGTACGTRSPLQLGYSMTRGNVTPGVLAVLLGLLSGGACTPEPAQSGQDELPEARALPVPAGAGAAQPNLATWGDRALLSWIEPDGDGHALRFATWDGSAWSDPATIARGEHWFVNWADFPSVLALDDRTLVAHWLQRSGPGTYAYDVMITRSADGGATWSEPERPHGDGTETEHGFASLFPYGDGAGVVWLDGRRYADGDEPASNEMGVRFTTVDASGAAGAETLLDPRACDCCQTAVAVTSTGPVVAYRDRTGDEIRDIAVTRLVDGAWTEPAVLHADNWHITGCPVNGPQADAQDDRVAIAWFTAAADSPRVQVAFSADAGATFAAPVRIDDGDPLGRVDVLMRRNGDAVVLWLESAGDRAELRARIVSPNGSRGPSRLIAPMSAQRPSGFPRAAWRGDELLIAWTDPDAGPAIRAAGIRLER